MKKTKIAAILLTSCCALALALTGLFGFVMPQNAATVYAAADSKNKFAIEDVPALAFITEDGETRYKFTYNFKLLDMNYGKLLSNTKFGAFKTTWWGATSENFFAYTFTVRRHSIAGGTDKATPVYRVAYIYNFQKYKNGEFYLRRTVAAVSLYGNYNYLTVESSDKLGEIQPSNEDWQSYGSLPASVRSYMSGLNLAMLSSGMIYDEGLGFKNSIVGLSFAVSSADTAYSVSADACYYYATWTGVFKTDYAKESFTCQSSSGVSAYTRLAALRDNEKLEETYFGEDLETANAVLNANETKKVTIRYLVPIEGTPFATMTSAHVMVRKGGSNKAVHDDVLAQLGLSTFKVLDSFEQVTDGYFKQYSSDADGETLEVVYNKAKWLRSITKEGNYLDYFIGLQSYYDTYYKFSVSGDKSFKVFADGLYELYFNNYILSDYPQLDGYAAKDVYGYFGFVVTPQTLSLDSVFDFFFDSKTSKVGVLNTKTFDSVLSYDAYSSLLTDYNYSWLEKAFAYLGDFAGAGSTNAKFYMFFSELGVKEGAIGENGATSVEDTAGRTEQIANKVGTTVGNIANGALTFVDGAVNGVLSLGTGIKKFFNNAVVSAIMPYVLIIGGGVLLWYFFFKPKSRRRK